jgi:DUF4097 and DUF4098 domain-containing protein YvlB
LYVVDTADESITRSDGYLVFEEDGLGSGSFSIVNSETAELREDKNGWYRPSPNDDQKVLRWDIDGTDLIINLERQLYFESALVNGLLTFNDGINSEFINTDNVELKTKVLEIGDWNMDLDTYVLVPHGIADHTKIRNVQVIIRNDDLTITRELTHGDNGGNGGYWQIADGFGNENINLVRNSTQSFDNTNYNSTSFNRGWIYITYEN